MKAAELREMSDEQLELTLKEAADTLVSAAAPGPDRAARRPQRTAEAPPDDRPDQDDPARNASGQNCTKAKRQHKLIPLTVRTDSTRGYSEHMPKKQVHWRRHQRQDRPRPAGWRSPGWSSIPKYGKYIRRRTVCHVHDEENKSEAGRHGRDRRVPAPVEDQAVGAGPRGRREPAGRPGGDAGGGQGRTARRASEQPDGPMRIGCRRIARCERCRTQSDRTRRSEATKRPAVADEHQRTGGRLIGDGGAGVNHDSNANPTRRGRQHRRQGSDVHQGARRKPPAVRRPGRHHRLQRQERDPRQRRQEEDRWSGR